MLSTGRQTTIGKQGLLNITNECSLASYYLGINNLPCLIKSPLRTDNHPSFSLYTRDGKSVYYRDFATGEKGSLLELLSKLWSLSYDETIDRIYKDINYSNKDVKVNLIKDSNTNIKKLNDVATILECKTREWRDYDIEYWNSYGITLEWLKYADVYPISHKIILKNGRRMVFPADKYSYVYVHFKDNKVQLKIYSPYNTSGFKWSSNLDRSVWSLWEKIPQTGDNLIISSSLKDCLNIMNNLGIPAICLQGEGYIPKPHVIQQLKDRYKNIIVFYDNDYSTSVNSGHKDAEILCKEYGFSMIEIPAIYESKDPSDLYKKHGKNKYLKIMKELLTPVLWKNGEI